MEISMKLWTFFLLILFMSTNYLSIQGACGSFFFWSKSTRSFLPHTLYMPMKLLRFINRTERLNTDGVQEQHMTHPCTTIVSRISISFQCPGNRCKPEKVLKATFPSTSCKHQQDRVIHKDQILNPLPV